MILTNGKILNISEGKTNTFDFNQTQINLSKYTSKTTTTPKLQEVKTTHLFYCLFKTKNIFIDKDVIAKNLMFKCDDTISLKNKISQELFSRIFKPIYLPLLALIGGLLIIKSKNSERYTNYKLKIFVLGVIAISLSEISTKFYSIHFFETLIIFVIPIILFLSIYYFFWKHFNIKNL